MSVLVITEDHVETRAWQVFYHWIQEGKLVQQCELLFKPLTHSYRYMEMLVPI